MLIKDTKPDDIQKRLDDLEQFVLNLEQGRLENWTRINKLEKQMEGVLE